MAKLSFIIPVYKVEKFLPALIESLKAQTYTDWEALLVDDGSPDGSGAICDKAEAEDSRFRAIHKENGGVGSARNLGLDNAVGEYVQFVDSDDTLDKTMAEKVMTAAEKYNADIVAIGIVEEYSDEGGNIVRRFVRHTPMTGVYTDGPYKEHFAKLANQHFITLKTIRRSIIEDNHIRFTNKKIGEDGIFHIEVYKTNPKCIAFIDEPLYIYNAGRVGSASNSYHEERMNDNFYLAEKIEEVLNYWGLEEKYSKTLSYCYMLDLQLSIKNASLSPLSYGERVKWLRNILNDKKISGHVKNASVSDFGSKNDRIKMSLMKLKQSWAVMLLSGINNKRK